ncbi:MAG: DNA methyltransferase, partial [bacterium]
MFHEQVTNMLTAVIQDHHNYLPSSVARLENPQTDIPRIAKDKKLLSEIESAVQQIPTSHRLVQGDARKLSFIEDTSVHLVVTSPPYWTLKEYDGGAGDGQLGHVEDYDRFHDELDRVWRRCYKLLVPGGRLCIVVGDVCLPRRKAGRHLVMPLHADISVR